MVDPIASSPAPPDGRRWDAVVVGSGPNGLAAAIEIAGAGRSVLVLEAASTAGGGLRSGEITLPGFTHDLCSAVHPLGASSPFFASLPLAARGVEWVQPEVAIAHPLDGGRAAALHRRSADTRAGLGDDGARFARWIEPYTDRWDDLVDDVMRPLVHIPRHPITLARFGLPALTSSAWLGRRMFRSDEARALFAGCAAHSCLPLDSTLSASFGLLLMASAGAVGWPVVRGGSGRLADALVEELLARGGHLVCDRQVRTMADVPASRAVLFDLAAEQVAAIAGDHLPDRYRRRLTRVRRGPGVFKLDYALSGPVPWTADACRRAGTLHLGGEAVELSTAEAEVAAGRHPDRPYVLVAQQSIADPSRAPAGSHTLWAYCHVPNGSTVDMTERIERQIERFAPGFRDVVLARTASDCAWFERHDGAYRGGDISCGAYGIGPTIGRPTLGRAYRTPNERLFFCGAASPPGAGVHGMCGHHAARTVLATALA